MLINYQAENQGALNLEKKVTMNKSTRGNQILGTSELGYKGTSKLRS